MEDLKPALAALVEVVYSCFMIQVILMVLSLLVSDVQFWKVHLLMVPCASSCCFCTWWCLWHFGPDAPTRKLWFFHFLWFVCSESISWWYHHLVCSILSRGIDTSCGQHICSDSLFKGCQHCSSKASSPKAARQRLSHGCLGCTRISCQVFGGENMSHWCSPLSQPWEATGSTWEDLCWRIFGERLTCFFHFLEMVWIFASWKSQRLWNPVILYSLRQQMEIRFYMKLPILVCALTNKIPL